ncbi:cupin domain-containing protein [Nostoc sp. CHAB 5834]|nr:cupin domain-containing protein [Nostoc sp. CHAB 5834]
MMLRTLIEITAQPQNGTPPHIHSYENEAFYIQEGELEFQLDDEIILAIPGTFLHSPHILHLEIVMSIP